MIDLKIYNVSPLSTNCYLLTDKDTGEMAVVDPGGKNEQLIEYITDNGNKLKYVLLTHGHYDHIGYAKQMSDIFGAEILCSKNANVFLSDNMLNHSMYHDDIEVIKPFSADVILKDNDVIKLGNTEITFIETPGHTNGCGCFLFDDIMISGDTLFCESFGRTDLPTGSLSKLFTTFRRLNAIDKDYVVYPGHGISTTLSHEKKYNPLMSRL